MGSTIRTVCPWKRNTGWNFLVLLGGRLVKLILLEKVHRTFSAHAMQHAACKNSQSSNNCMPHDILLASPAKKNTEDSKRCFLSPRTYPLRIVRTLGRHQILKIAAWLFLEISAFFYLKLRVVGLCKKVLQEPLKGTAAIYHSPFLIYLLVFHVIFCCIKQGV